MRERRGTLVETAVAKVRREGVVPLLFGAPSWVCRAVTTEIYLRLLWRWRQAQYRRAGWQAVPDPTTTIEIDPTAVTHLVPLARFDESAPRTLLGAVRGGDWDCDLPRIESQPKYQACRARVEDGTDWEDTGIVDHLVAELEASDDDAIEHGCSSRADLHDRYRNERERLYRNLRNQGYDRDESPVCCRIHIGRDGRLLFGSGGRHRFYLSRLLGINSVPVQVLCRHKNWQVVRESVAAADDPDDLAPDVRRHLGHPDLREFAVAYEVSVREQRYVAPF